MTDLSKNVPDPQQPYPPYVPPAPPPLPPPALPAIGRPGTRLAVGPAVAVLGLALALIGTFGLPLSSEGSGKTGQDFGFVDLHWLRSTFDLDDFFGGVSGFWFDWGLFLFVALLAVTVAWSVTGRAQLITGAATAVLAAVTLVLHLLALGKAPTYRAVQTFHKDGESVLDNAGSGVWVGVVGLAVLIVGGVLTAVLGRTGRTRATASA